MRSRLPSRSPTTEFICASASLIRFSPQSLKLAYQPYGVEISVANLICAPDQLLDVVVLAVDVAAGQRVGPPRGEDTDEPRRELGRRPRRIVRCTLRHLGAYETGAEDEDGDVVGLELLREDVPEAPDRGLARRVGRAGRIRQVRRAAPRDDDSSAAAPDHPRDDRAAGEEDAEDVHLEDVPPLLGLDLPGALLTDIAPSIRHEQVDLADLGDPTLDV